uniref:allophycocyanin beta 18 subunit n=1 Tax=Timspurckia oligopyrenoides TaxID=708627 RepID=UPI001FCDD181|nr:allophycocyanin beta 18 subunit [Timspurckia oligopyrenoides]UNJ17447.1 allophycocyanin beta 18 subunit [Timspurckia oligopyrenoides]
MQDAITSIINKYDLSGKYLDMAGMENLVAYFNSGVDRLQIASFINKEAASIVKEASERLFSDQPELLRPPGNALTGNAYTTRRYAACLRDIEYYLRYASYAIVAGNNNILDERVLNGLRETYNSLLVPIAPTIKVISILKVIIEEKFVTNSREKEILSSSFEHMIYSLTNSDI